MPNAAVITIALAVAGGLSVIAFKTPKIFLRLTLPLIGLLAVGQLLTLAWDVVFRLAHSAFSEFISVDKAAAAEAVLAKHLVPSWFSFMSFAGVILIFFLWWLSNQVINHMDNHPPHQKLNDE
ncbi:hypothetical protein EZJ19_15230 [Parasulfuritortus cantonensis]|uniref:Uncharacterized protein n=1 Tax=Parasulfuritortus cantonensis TaxID=2528202 RepID=A0A4R1B0V5_9PROT|nr:hypothetical protein [Parasulfuritortus cantonensis]TCJ11622.1 hypothetical protein EZJ19_15230 [Parasulfuritortus cantonensis]